MGNNVSNSTVTPNSGGSGGNGCNIVAALDCLILDHRGWPHQECDELLDPRTVECTDANPATGLAFKYADGGSYPDQAYVTVAGGRSGEVFGRVVQMGEVFEVNGDFRGQVEVKIYTVDASSMGEGTLLETHNVDTYCDSNSKLTLTSMFGPLELTGFTNALGKMSSIKNIQLDYYVGNDSTEPVDATAALISSGLQKPFDALNSPRRLEGNDQPLVWPFAIDLYDSVYTETATVDFGEMFKSGNMLTFSMEATGKTDSGTECTGQAQFSF